MHIATVQYIIPVKMPCLFLFFFSIRSCFGHDFILVFVLYKIFIFLPTDRQQENFFLRAVVMCLNRGVLGGCHKVLYSDSEGCNSTFSKVAF
jgi:hypothetical protein